MRTSNFYLSTPNFQLFMSFFVVFCAFLYFMLTEKLKLLIYKIDNY